MKHCTLVESDGKTVYITSAMQVTAAGKAFWVLCSLLLLGLFLLVPLWLSTLQVRQYALLWLVLPVMLGYPVWWRMATLFLKEEVQLNTEKLVCVRSYGFFRSRKLTIPYGKHCLATGADAVNKTASQLRVSWFSEDAQTHRPQLLYRHFFPMAAPDYEQAKEYIQELFDLENEATYPLLFSAN